MRKTSFTLENCIEVLEKTDIEYGIKKNGSISLTDFNFIITRVTKKTHPNFLKQFITSLTDIGCVELNQNKNVITILKELDDFK
jgi:hypothetical protein